MPPSPETEQQLLALLDRHLRSTEQAISKLEQRLDKAVTRMDAVIARVEARLDALASTLAEAMSAQKMAVKWNIVANILLVVVVAALGGANLYVQANKDGATIATGSAVSSVQVDR